MKALYFHADTRSFALGDFPDEAVPAGHVVVRIRSVGICGSDMHSYEFGEAAGAKIETPYVLGHEFAGTVEDLAPDIRDAGFAVGDRVAVDPQLPCHHCFYCQSGREHICPHMKFIGGYPLHGGMRERMVLPLHNVHAIPDDASYDHGVLAEPLSVSLHATRLAGSLIDREVAIIGAGPIGNLVAQCVHLQTGRQVLISDPIAERRNLALQLGATTAIDPTKETIAETARRFERGFGPDVVFEATRTAEGLNSAIDLVAPGGTVIYIGIANDPVPVVTGVGRRKEVTLQWVRRSLRCYPTALRLLADGRVNGDAIVTHRTDLDGAAGAMELVRGYEDGVMKYMVDVEKA